MSSDDETHYEVLGVDPGASKEAIRAAYQERIDAARADQSREQEAKRPNEAAIASARAEEARVRGAWQVLSDPYQRGRYDQSIEVPSTDGDGDGDGDVDVDDEDVVDDADVTESRNGSRSRELTPRQQRAEERAQRAAEMRANRPPGLFSTEHPPTPPTWPSGFQAPPPRARFLAMMVDIVVLSIFLFGQQVLSPVLLDEMYPKESKALDQVTDQVDDMNSCLDVKQAKRADASVCAHVESVLTADDKQLTDHNIEKQRDKLEDKQTDLRNDMIGGQLAITFGTLAIMLLYLIPSTTRTGRTLGKRLLQIRVVQADGSRVTFSPALSRYGAPLVFALFLGSFLGPLAFGIALFGVLTWPRNASYQGLHDRLARTIVVDG